VELGRRLRTFRARYGLTQDEVAAVIVAAEGSVVSQWESGVAVPDGVRREPLTELLERRLREGVGVLVAAIPEDLQAVGSPAAHGLCWLELASGLRIDLSRSLASQLGLAMLCAESDDRPADA
jgi:transcriptional regulator with XRE-family HTH domain